MTDPDIAVAEVALLRSTDGHSDWAWQNYYIPLRADALDALARLEARLEAAEKALDAADELADSYGRQWARDSKFYDYMDLRALAGKDAA